MRKKIWFKKFLTTYYPVSWQGWLLVLTWWIGTPAAIFIAMVALGYLGYRDDPMPVAIAVMIASTMAMLVTAMLHSSD